MKKSIAIIAVIASILGLLLALCPACAEENVERSGNALWTYTAEGKAATLTGYFGSETDVEIPETLDGLPVTAIAEACFRGSALVSVTVPAAVEHIGARAFSDSGALTAAFLNCASLEMDEGAFSGCGHLSVVLIEDDDALLAGNAFENCKALRLIAGGEDSEASELAEALGVRFARLNREAPAPAEQPEAGDAQPAHSGESKTAKEEPVFINEWVGTFDKSAVTATVTAKGSAGLRPGPNKKEPYFARIPSGTVIRVLSIEENGWLKVVTEKNEKGYISGKLAEIDWDTLLPYYSSFVRIRGTGNANVHRYADISALDLGRVPVGKVYPLMGVARNGWFKILLDDGCSQGYVSDSMAEYIGTDWRTEETSQP